MKGFFFYRAPEHEIWRHVEFVLRQDQQKGAQVFIERTTEQPLDENHCDKILKFLDQYPAARMAFLEHIVNTMESKVYLV